MSKLKICIKTQTTLASGHLKGQALRVHPDRDYPKIEVTLAHFGFYTPLGFYTLLGFYTPFGFYIPLGFCTVLGFYTPLGFCTVLGIYTRLGFCTPLGLYILLGFYTAFNRKDFSV